MYLDGVMELHFVYFYKDMLVNGFKKKVVCEWGI